MKGTALTASGLRDWCVQRFSALYGVGYTVYLLWIYQSLKPMTHSKLLALFSTLSFKILGSLFVGLMLMHAWIGLWTVLTDYVRPLFLQGLLMLLVILYILVLLVMGLSLFWGGL